MSQTATLILTHGKIHTLERQNPQVEAVAIANGKITATGSHDRIMSFATDGTQVVDLQGHTVIPGLNDSHLHLIRGGLNYNWNCVGKAYRRWRTRCACSKSRLTERHRRNGCAWWAAGANSSLPNVACQPSKN